MLRAPCLSEFLHRNWSTVDQSPSNVSGRCYPSASGFPHLVMPTLENNLSLEHHTPQSGPQLATQELYFRCAVCHPRLSVLFTMLPQPTTRGHHRSISLLSKMFCSFEALGFCKFRRESTAQKAAHVLRVSTVRSLDLR